MAKKDYPDRKRVFLQHIQASPITIRKTPGNIHTTVFHRGTETLGRGAALVHAPRVRPPLAVTNTNAPKHVVTILFITHVKRTRVHRRPRQPPHTSCASSIHRRPRQPPHLSCASSKATASTHYPSISLSTTTVRCWSACMCTSPPCPANTTTKTNQEKACGGIVETVCHLNEGREPACLPACLPGRNAIFRAAFGNPQDC